MSRFHTEGGTLAFRNRTACTHPTGTCREESEWLTQWHGSVGTLQVARRTTLTDFPRLFKEPPIGSRFPYRYRNAYRG
jgi:hypothetical protein